MHVNIIFYFLSAFSVISVSNGQTRTSRQISDNEENQCEPLHSNKLRIICLNPQGEPIPCDEPLPTNSTAIFSCNPFMYKKIREPEYGRIKCRNGQWDRSLIDDFCVVQCGRPVLESEQPKISAEVRYGEFPWHAGVYKEEDGDFKRICEGTLISDKIVITGAICISLAMESLQTNVTDPSIFKIGLGKYYRTLNPPMRENLAQIMDVEKIEMSPWYLGSRSFYAGDIAVIVLKTPVEFTTAVRPVCIDLEKGNFERDQLKKGAIGKVPTWGVKPPKDSGQTFHVMEMPFVPADECKSTISSSLLPFVRPDKICAGDKSSEKTLCRYDVGGGLVFEDTNTDAYYLRGLVSLGSKSCKGKEYVLFTKLSSHRDFIEEHLQLL